MTQSGDPISSRKWPTQDSLADIVRSLYFIQKSHEISPVYLRSLAVYPDVLHMLVTNLRLDLLRKSHHPAPSQVGGKTWYPNDETIPTFFSPVPSAHRPSRTSQLHLAGGAPGPPGPGWGREGLMECLGKPTGNTGGSPKYWVAPITPKTFFVGNNCWIKR